ncbi:MAG: hypothetical protein Q8M92_03975, partial [Candidatus Subteraquimicrobiales bacterium]|nr:hypothetical protein [Candidatus Subteraquimicrobiales bacterium]
LNRIWGQHRRLKQYKKGEDHIAKAMKEARKSWLYAYTGEYDTYAFWWVFVEINDIIQTRGGDGVWGGRISRKKYYECFQYRTLYHDDKKSAFHDELYSALFGWW